MAIVEQQTRGDSVGWRCDSSKMLFESKWYDLRSDRVALPDGKVISYTFMQHPGAALVIPITTEGKVVLMRSYRYPVDEWCWGLPGGGLGDKDGSSPEDVARAELGEELGASAAELQYLGAYFLATGVAELRVHYFLATEVELDLATQREATEVIDGVEVCSVEEAIEKISQGEINEVESAFGIMLASQFLAASPPRKPR